MSSKNDYLREVCNTLVELYSPRKPSMSNHDTKTERTMIEFHNRAGRHTCIAPATAYEVNIVAETQKAMADQSRPKIETKRFLVSLALSQDVEDEPEDKRRQLRIWMLAELGSTT